jgi:hypothetical protein
MSMKIKIEVLDAGDEVIGFSENRIAIKKKSGEMEIITISFDENNIPRVDERTIVVTFKSSSSGKASIIDDKSGFEVGSF